MSLAAATRLGPYEVLGLIGAGGMGEVYKARDTRLDRDVAIKILPAGVASDPTRRARFEREARTISSLNHPHICTLYDVGDEDGQAFLVMEHLSGETLADRLARGPLAVPRALEIGAEIAEALAAAHAQGVVHRDLKPANVMLTNTGAKLLDFGLAKLREPAVPPAAVGSTMVRTNTQPLTGRGTIVGTLHYMAPEQLEGREADPRADLWALGVILYEMLTGQRPFGGTNSASLIANIMKAEPATLDALQPLTPPALKRLVTRCLAKRPEDRWHSAHDFADELRWIAQSDSADRAVAPPFAFDERKGRRVPAWAVAPAVVVLCVGAASVAWRWLPALGGHSDATERQLVLFTSSDDAVQDPALSPDGKMIAFVAERDGQTDLFVSRVAGGARVRLTNDTAHERSPAFSPDGERIAFARRDLAAEVANVFVIPALGGEPVLVARGAKAPAWSPDGQHLAVVSAQHERSQDLAIVRTDGSDTRVVLRADATYPFLRNTSWSPDGRQLVVERSSGGISGEIWIVPSAGGRATRLCQDPPGVFSHSPRFARDGRAVIHSSNRGGSTNLWRLPLDGTPITQLTSGPGPDLSPSIGLDGTIAFLNERWRTLLLLFDLRGGEAKTLLNHASPLWAPAFSPDGKELAFSRAEADGQWHIWSLSLATGTARQLTSGPIPEIYPRFTPDGRGVVYCTWAPRGNRLWLVPRPGGPPRSLPAQADDDEQYADVSPDGRQIAFVRTQDGTSRLYLARLDPPGPATELPLSPATLPRWSPDGRLIAFARDRGMDSGIFVATPDGLDARQLTHTGGWPVWWPDGRQIGFLVNGADGNQQIWITPVDGGSIFRLDSIRHTVTNAPFDISPDGRWLATTDGRRVVSEIWLLKPGG